MATIIAVPALAIATLNEMDETVLLLAEVELYQNDITPGPTVLLAEYTLATYTGYAAKVLATQEPSVSDAGVPELVYSLGNYRPTGDTVTNVVYGGLILDSTGVLLAAFRFDGGPFPMLSTLDVVNLVLRVRGFTGSAGLVVEVS